MNTMNENAQAMINNTLTEAVVELTQLLKEAISLAKEEEAVSTTEATTVTTETTTAAETTATTEANSTTPIIVLDDDDTIIATTATTETTTATTETTTATTETTTATTTPETTTAAEATSTTATETTPETTTATADEEDNTEFEGSMIEQDPTADISALYDIAEFALSHEGKNIESDRSPYAPKENKMGVIGDYQVFISKEITKDGDHIEGSFRLIIKDKSIVTPIMDLNIHLIDSCAKAFSSENTHRIEQMKEDHDLMRFLNIVEEISSVVMSKYNK